MSQKINNLNSINELSDNDYLPIYDKSTGITGKVELSDLIEYLPEPQLGRKQLTYSTFNSLSIGQSEDATLQLGKTYALLSIIASQKCRLRLYASSASRESDRVRNTTTDPTGNHGLLLEVIFNNSLTLNLAPMILGYTIDPGTNAIINSLSLTPQKVNLFFTYLILES